MPRTIVITGVSSGIGAALEVTRMMPGLMSTDFARNVLHGTPPSPPGAARVPSQTADQVAEAIGGVIDHPVAEIYTNPHLAGLVRRYVEDVSAFEAQMQRPRQP